MSCIKNYEFIQYKIGDIMIIRTFIYYVIFYLYKRYKKEKIEQVNILLIMLIGINIFFLPLYLIFNYLNKFLIIKEKERSVLIKNGVLNFNNLVELNYSLESLFTEVKKAGFNSFEEVNLAILYDGVISFSN